MNANKAYTDEYLQHVAALDGDAQGMKAARSHMEHSTAIYHGTVVNSSYVPRFFDQKTYDYFKYASETTHRILMKVMREYLENPEYRHVYDIDERLVD